MKYQITEEDAKKMCVALYSMIDAVYGQAEHDIGNGDGLTVEECKLIKEILAKHPQGNIWQNVGHQPNMIEIVKEKKEYPYMHLEPGSNEDNIVNFCNKCENKIKNQIHRCFRCKKFYKHGDQHPDLEMNFIPKEQGISDLRD